MEFLKESMTETHVLQRTRTVKGQTICIWRKKRNIKDKNPVFTLGNLKFKTMTEGIKYINSLYEKA